MDAKRFIDEAITLGSQSGLSGLDPLQRKVFLISEAEVCCDMDGFDSFINSYEPAMLLEAAEAFSAVGASATGAGLQEIAQSLPSASEELIEHVNTLICKRSGYDFDSIVRYVESNT